MEIVDVSDEDKLLRTVWYPDPRYIRDDMTVTSFAFALRKNKGETYLSVDLEKFTSYEQSIGDPAKFRLFSLYAGEVRSIGCDCNHMPEPDNYSHAGITGSITNRISSQLSKLAVFVHFP